MEPFPHQDASSGWAFSARLCVALATLLLFAGPSSAGIRGPGKYSGVVVFDRWDGCLLFSSVYLMYISEVVKDDLRSYAGQAIQIDALDVLQRVNPGDGLIRKFKVLGPAPEKHLGAIPEGLFLVADGPFPNRGLPAVTLEIRNQGAKSATVDSSKIGLALLTKKQEGYYAFDPSDGPSTAIITRVSVLNPGGKFWWSLDGVKHSFSYTIDPENRLPHSFDLDPGRSRSTTVTFEIPPGEYQFISGYGGGVHEERSLVSNPVSFDVNEAPVGRQSLLDYPVRIWSHLRK